MKKILLILIVLSTYLFAQEELIDNKQFMLGCTYVESSEQVTHYIQAQGIVWEYSSGSGVISSNQLAYNNSLVTTGNANFSSADWPGFNFVWLNTQNQMPRWGLGIYKVTNSKQTDKYFYLDSRDYAYGSITGGYSNPDFYIYFNNNVGKYVQRSTDIQITNGSVVRIWEIFNKTPNTSNLQNYWSNALVLVNQDNHPRIIWGPYQDNGLYVQYYKIYKKKGTGNFNLLTTSTSYEYTDVNEVIPTQPSTQVPVYYYVTALGQLTESNYESGPTNTVSINVRGGFEKIHQEYSDEVLNNYLLFQNYPNPFNPSTKISYSIKKGGFVTLKVYDVLGKEIATLVNENKPAGFYEVDFNASPLTSGMYIYKIQSGSFTDVKKMLLTK